MEVQQSYFKENKKNPLLNLHNRWEWILYKKWEYLRKWFHEDEYRNHVIKLAQCHMKRK